jgi:two-component system KDP operon response regulator KdpE
VVVLDLGLPDLDGLEVCRRVRAWTSVPIIVLSAAGSEDRKVAALDGGADDYVTKPFGMDELQARVRAALRRRRSGRTEGPPAVEVGALRLDRSARTASLAGVPLELTPTEWQLLAELAAEAGRTCTRDHLLTAVWGQGGGDASHLHSYVHRLRHKLGTASGVVIRTVPGIGYSLASGASE